MFSLFPRFTRPLSRPAASLLSYKTPVSLIGARLAAGTMASSTAEQNFARTISTAACLIIGDEVLGGKVFFFTPLMTRGVTVWDYVADVPLYRPKM